MAKIKKAHRLKSRKNIFLLFNFVYKSPLKAGIQQEGITARCRLFHIPFQRIKRNSSIESMRQATAVIVDINLG